VGQASSLPRWADFESAVKGQAMRTFVFWAVLVVAGFVFAPRAHAKILPSFNLTSAATAAATVIVVEEGKVVEAWAGDMKVGDAYPPASVVPRGYKAVYGFGSLVDDAEIDRQLAAKGLKRVGSVSGKRLVFFIPPNPPKSVGEKFLASSHAYSTVWIEEGQAFAIQQWINPGPAEMRPLDMSEAELKQAVLDLRAVDAKLRKINEEADYGKRAQDLLPLLKAGNHLVNKEVKRSIRHCGKEAWPAIEAMIANDEHLPLHGELLSLAHQLARQDAVPVFQRVLAAEREYFQRLDEAGTKYDRRDPPHLYHEQRRSAAQRALDNSQ
jgi:hypothetical protein